MDRHLGQTTLGVWDFAWSCMAYLKLAHIGVAPATSRYLARHRAMGDAEGVRRVASATTAVSIGVAAVVVALTALIVLLMPRFFATRLGDQLATAQWVVAVLGAGLAFDFLCQVFSGALTASHRWDLHIGLNTASNFVSAVAMIVALSFGGGLRALAFAHTGAGVVSELARMVVAYRVMPELRIRAGDFTMKQARQILSFGGKVSVPALAWLVMTQTNVLVVVGHLGPAALALYARPGALLRLPDFLVRRVAMVLQPMASSLQGLGRPQEIQHLALQGIRYAAALTLPAMLGLIILGGPLLRVWMGDRYDQSLVLTILVLGVTLSLTLRPARAVLTGLNLHGFVAMESTLAALIGTGLTLLNVVVLDLGLVGAALAVSLPQFGLSLLILYYVGRKLDIRLGEIFREGYRAPLACTLPFGLVLLGSRLTFADQPLLAVVCGSAAGGLVLLPLYWRFLAPAQLRRLVLARLPDMLGRGLGRFAS
jgi:O-antigen/teichoic acid export membrane protein